MGNLVQVYTGRDVNVIFGAIIFDKIGRDEEEFVRLEQEGDDVQEEYDIDGNVLISPNFACKYSAVVTLSQSSPTNDKLSVILALKSVPGLAGFIHPFAVKDPNGTSMHQAANSWIRKAPNSSYANKKSKREWVFGLAGYTQFIGSSLVVGS